MENCSGASAKASAVRPSILRWTAESSTAWAWDGVPGRQLFRLRAKDGVFDNWISRGSAALAVPDLWAERTDKGQMPDRADGMDVKHGVLYLTFSAADFRPDDISDLAALTRKVLARRHGRPAPAEAGQPAIS